MRRIEDGTDLRDAYLELAGEARHSLAILSRDLEPGVLGTGEFCEAVKRLVLENRRAQVQILAHDPAAAARTTHRLIELARRLSSFIEIRRLGPDDRELTEAFIVADRRLVVHRIYGDRPQGEYAEDRARARELDQRFRELWERAEFDPEVRRLHL